MPGHGSHVTSQSSLMLGAEWDALSLCSCSRLSLFHLLAHTCTLTHLFLSVFSINFVHFSRLYDLICLHCHELHVRGMYTSVLASACSWIHLLIFTIPPFVSLWPVFFFFACWTQRFFLFRFSMCSFYWSGVWVCLCIKLRLFVFLWFIYFMCSY